MADPEGTEKDPNLDDLWSQLDPDTQEKVINLFLHVCYQFLVCRTTSTPDHDERTIDVESRSLE